MVVIGAGPYGLSTAAHLRAAGADVRIFGESMAGWRRHMPAGMFLKSTASASSISAPTPGFTLHDFCRETGLAFLDDGQPVPIDLFVRYGLRFQERLVPMIERVRVRRLSRAGQAFELELESGATLQAGAVVVATGLVDFAHLPAELLRIALEASGPEGYVSHSCQHGESSTFAGKEVAVIGGGQSALESAALMHEAGTLVHVLVRANEVRYASPPEEAGGPRIHPLLKPPSPLGPGWSLIALSSAPGMVRHLPQTARLQLVRSLLGASGAWWLRERIVGRVDVRTGQTLRGASLEGNRVVLRLESADGGLSRMVVDHVIAATGYRVDLDRLDFIEPSLRGELRRVRGWPRLSASFESSVPSLFFIGLPAAATFGPVMRFVCGSGFAARRVSAAAASGRQTRPALLA